MRLTEDQITAEPNDKLAWWIEQLFFCKSGVVLLGMG
jgi:hypothetical protein